MKDTYTSHEEAFRSYLADADAYDKALARKYRIPVSVISYVSRANSDGVVHSLGDFMSKRKPRQPPGYLSALKAHATNPAKIRFEYACFVWLSELTQTGLNLKAEADRGLSLADYRARVQFD